jgi:LysM repeat protein
MPAGSRVAFDATFPELYRTARLARTEPARHAGVVSTGGAAPAAPAPVRSVAATHRVRQGETLSHIARRHGVSVAALRSANGNVDPRRLRPGQTLRVPASSASASARTARAPAPRIHQVRRGENLTVIARRYGVTIRQIQAWNGLRGTRIQAGQRLRINA